MADVFISYAREDRLCASAVAKAIASRGWSVWWDRKIRPGDTFSEVIERQLAAARCVVVLWSRSSVSAEWVLTEAAEGARRKILIPAILENVSTPLEFRRRQAADLTTWTPHRLSSELEELLEAIATMLGTSVDASGTTPRCSPGNPRASRMRAIAGFLSGAVTIVMLQLQPNTIQPSHDNEVKERVSRAKSLPAEDEHDVVALNDMRLYGDGDLNPASFVRLESWSPDWYLRFADVTHDGKSVRLYHAMSRHSSEIRFVSQWGEGRQPSPWHAVGL